jgi:hypothetical protein
MSSVRVTLAIGIALTVAVGAYVLTRSPPRVVRSNGSGALGSLGVTQGEFSICQGNEVLPAGVSAIRFSLIAFLGSNLQVAVYHDGQLIAEGTHNPDWSGTSPTVRITPVDRTTSNAELCVSFIPNSELLQIFGLQAPARDAAVAFQDKQITPRPPSGSSTPLRGKLFVSYLGPGRGSWWSRAGSVITRMGLGHFIGGKWVALLAALLMATVGVLTVRLTLREQP